MIAIAPTSIMASSICIVLYRSFDPVIVYSLGTPFVACPSRRDIFVSLRHFIVPYYVGEERKYLQVNASLKIFSCKHYSRKYMIF